jgi:hypothetical protein
MSRKEIANEATEDATARLTGSTTMNACVFVYKSMYECMYVWQILCYPRVQWNYHVCASVCTHSLLLTKTLMCKIFTLLQSPIYTFYFAFKGLKEGFLPDC